MTPSAVAYTPERAARVRAAFTTALGAPDARKARGRRHPLEVTSDRIADHLSQHHDHLTGAERDALSDARRILESLI